MDNFWIQLRNQDTSSTPPNLSAHQSQIIPLLSSVIYEFFIKFTLSFTVSFETPLYNKKEI